MRVWPAFSLAGLIAVVPFGGITRSQEFSPPAAGWLDLLQGREVEWLFSQPEVLPDGSGPWLGPRQMPTAKAMPPGNGPSVPAGCGIAFFFPPNPVRPCFGYAPTWDSRTRDRVVLQTYFGVGNARISTSNFRGDFWLPGE